MEYEQMETFLIVAKTKSFSRAAEILHVAQTTVSVRIQQLERHVGRRLIDRNTRSLELTEAGTALYPYIERVMDLIGEGKCVMELSDRFSGRLIIGGLNSLWDQTFSNYLTSYINHHPDVAIKVVNGHSDEIYSKIKDGTVDIGFVSSPAPNHSFVTVPLYNEGILLVKSPSYHLKMKTINLAKSTNLPMIYMDWGPPFSDWLKTETRGMNFFGLEVDSSTLLIELLKSNTGIGFLLENLAKKYIQNGELEEIRYTGEHQSPLKTIYLAYSKRKKDKVEIKEFASYMKNIYLKESTL